MTSQEITLLQIIIALFGVWGFIIYVCKAPTRGQDDTFFGGLAIAAIIGACYILYRVILVL